MDLCSYHWFNPEEGEETSCKYSGQEICSVCNQCRTHCPSHYSYSHGLDTSNILLYYGFKDEKKKAV